MQTLYYGFRKHTTPKKFLRLFVYVRVRGGPIVIWPMSNAQMEVMSTWLGLLAVVFLDIKPVQTGSLSTHLHFQLFMGVVCCG